MALQDGPPEKKKKYCRFCKNRIPIDYKDEATLSLLVNVRGKILPKRVTGTCAKHQRAVATAIKQSRYYGILPYVRDIES